MHDPNKDTNYRRLKPILSILTLLIMLLLCMVLATIAFVFPTPLHQHVPDTSHWELISSFSLPPSIPVYKFRSNLTGLSVVLAEAESPIVNGYFCLATEADSHDGLPHTLEHLIFLGSQEYPYKNVLDLLANRCLAGKTNAWTAVDHTCYTVKTAGTSGFLNILPIYMDHILYPLLREQDFVTEVHHVNGEGKDGGVVYSEMQGRELSAGNVVSFQTKEFLYPGESGYSKNTGGYLNNLRNSTSIQKIRNYHQKFYRPENLLLTIIGRINSQDVFKQLNKIEEKILIKREKNMPEPYKRPWQEKIAPFLEEKEIIVDYGSDDDKLGRLSVAWRLNNQKLANNIENLYIYELLMKYLTVSQVSPFEDAFVQKSNALSTAVIYDTFKFSEPSLKFDFHHVPTDRLNEIVPKMDQILKEVVRNGSKHFDLDMIHNFIDRETVFTIQNLENSPRLLLPHASILDMLYGQKSQHLEEFTKVNLNKEYLKNENEQFWLNKIEDIFLKTPKLVVKGKPKKEILINNIINEMDRTDKQIRDLGPSGLRNAAQLIEDTIRSQSLPGHDVLTKVPEGDVDSIQFRELTSYNRSQNLNNLFDFSSIPYKVQIDHVNSNFVEFYIFMDTFKLNQRQKKLLPLLMNTWLVSPIKRDGQPFQISQVIKRKAKYIQSLTNGLGFSGSTFSPGGYSDSYLIKARSTLSNFEEACLFLRDAINFPHFLKEKILITAEALLKSLSPKKSSAASLLGTLNDGIYFDSSSNIYHSSFLRQKHFLKTIVKELKSNSNKVINEIYNITKSLTQPDNAFVYLATNAQKLAKQYGANLSLISTLLNGSPETVTKREGSSQRYQVRSEQEQRNVDSSIPRHLAVEVGGTESCYLKLSVLYNNTDWTHPEVPILRVMTQYLSDRLYDVVRGAGLSYGVSLGVSVTEGRMYLTLTRSSQIVTAYKKVLETFNKFMSSENWDKTLLESSKGAIVYTWAKKEDTIENLVKTAVKTYMWRTHSKYNREFVKKLDNVSLDEVIKAAKKFLLLFLTPEATQTVIVCGPAKIDKVVDYFRKRDINMQKFDSSQLESSFLAQ